MMSWLRRFPHDVIQRRKSNNAGGGRRAASSTSWRNKNNSSFTARIIRCASSVVDRRHQDPPSTEEDDDDDLPSPAAPPPPDNNVRELQVFSFRELAEAAGSFRQEHLIGEGGFGRVYKARLMKQQEEEEEVVAVKQLDREGAQGNGEFVVEVLMLSMLHHPNLVSLVGYCAEGRQRLLVYEYMDRGSLEAHLHFPSSNAAGGLLGWPRRMAIAAGAARGLEYLHDRGVIFRDLKPSNILLHADYTPRLSDFGLARLLPPPSSSSSSSLSSSTVMGTFGYCAPEYLRTGKLSAKSDVYSFGVVLLELITGRRAIDAARPDGQQSLVGWAAPIFADPTRLPDLVDPRLVMAMEGPPPSELKQAVGVAAMCLQEHHALRPVMADVVTALTFLSS